MAIVTNTSGLSLLISLWLLACNPEPQPGASRARSRPATTTESAFFKDLEKKKQDELEAAKKRAAASGRTGQSGAGSPEARALATCKAEKKRSDPTADDETVKAECESELADAQWNQGANAYTGAGGPQSEVLVNGKPAASGAKPGMMEGIVTTGKGVLGKLGSIVGGVLGLTSGDNAENSKAPPAPQDKAQPDHHD